MNFLTMNFLTLLSGGTTSGLNQQWVTDFLGLFSDVLTDVFTKFPLNLMLVGALACAAVHLFAKAKRAVSN